MSLSIPITSFHLAVLCMFVSVCWTGIPLKCETGRGEWNVGLDLITKHGTAWDLNMGLYSTD